MLESTARGKQAVRADRPGLRVLARRIVEAKAWRRQDEQIAWGLARARPTATVLSVSRWRAMSSRAPLAGAGTRSPRGRASGWCALEPGLVHPGSGERGLRRATRAMRPTRRSSARRSRLRCYVGERAIAGGLGCGTWGARVALVVDATAALARARSRTCSMRRLGGARWRSCRSSRSRPSKSRLAADDGGLDRDRGDRRPTSAIRRWGWTAVRCGGAPADWPSRRAPG